MRIIPVLAFLLLPGLLVAQDESRNQEQLQKKVFLYWTAMVEQDYRAAYDMYSPDAHSFAVYGAWLHNQGIQETPPGKATYRLVSAKVESISCSDDPRFKHMCEVSARLTVISADDQQAETVKTNVWEIHGDGTWYPSMPWNTDF